MRVKKRQYLLKIILFERGIPMCRIKNLRLVKNKIQYNKIKNVNDIEKILIKWYVAEFVQNENYKIKLENYNSNEIERPCLWKN